MTKIYAKSLLQTVKEPSLISKVLAFGFFKKFFYFKKSLKTRYIDRAVLHTR